MIASLVLMSFVEGPAISTVEHSMKGPLIEKVGHTRHLSSTIGIHPPNSSLFFLPTSNVLYRLEYYHNKLTKVQLESTTQQKGKRTMHQTKMTN
jgi:hypothetical protein